MYGRYRRPPPEYPEYVFLNDRNNNGGGYQNFLVRELLRELRKDKEKDKEKDKKKDDKKEGVNIRDLLAVGFILTWLGPFVGMLFERLTAALH